MAVVYIKMTYALQLHDFVIEMSGGLDGVKDEGQVDSILAHIQNDSYYPAFEEKLTHLVFGFVKYHCFNDGNKRTALALGAYFLELNGYDLVVDIFIREMENIVVWVAENRIGKPLLRRLITSICAGEEYSDTLKLELINTLKKED